MPPAVIGSPPGYGLPKQVGGRKASSKTGLNPLMGSEPKSGGGRFVKKVIRFANLAALRMSCWHDFVSNCCSLIGEGEIDQLPEPKTFK
jgi:hypothetical protein